MIKKKICPNCGKEFSGQNKYCHYLCSMPVMVEAQKQLRKHKGPVYEKWKERLKARIEQL